MGEDVFVGGGGVEGDGPSIYSLISHNFLLSAELTERGI